MTNNSNEKRGPAAWQCHLGGAASGPAAAHRSCGPGWQARRCGWPSGKPGGPAVRREPACHGQPQGHSAAEPGSEPQARGGPGLEGVLLEGSAVGRLQPPAIRLRCELGHPTRWMPLLSFYEGRARGSERLSNFTRDTQLGYRHGSEPQRWRCHPIQPHYGPVLSIWGRWQPRPQSWERLFWDPCPRP